MAQGDDEDAAHHHLVVLVVSFDHVHRLSCHIEGVLPQRDLCKALIPLCGAGKGCGVGFNRGSVAVVVEHCEDLLHHLSGWAPYRSVGLDIRPVEAVDVGPPLRPDSVVPNRARTAR